MLMGVTVWFNFAFYGFRAYIAPYIAENFYPHLSSAQAMQHADVLSAGFLALMYATPIIGGYVADKILGEVRALLISLWLGVLSLLLMALPSLAGFELGLALFALSVGLSVPLTVLIGLNYAKGDARREGGYTLYYMAINFGAAIAPLICGIIIRSSFLVTAGALLPPPSAWRWRQSCFNCFIACCGRLYRRANTYMAPWRLYG